MLRDRYEPMDIFSLVPKLSLEMEPELCQIDKLLDDDVLFGQLRAELVMRYPNTATLGRHSTPVEVILRMLVVKHLYGFSYEGTEHLVSDSLVLRQFCRVYLEPVPDDTTLIRWANQIGPDTVAGLNQRVVELARSLKVTRGRKLRVDSTVVETNIHHPADSAILGDGVRVLSRLLHKAKAVLGEGSGLSKKVFRSRLRSVRRLAQQMHRIGRSKGEEGSVQLKRAYEQLIKVAQKSLYQGVKLRDVLGKQTDRRFQQLAGQFDGFLPLVQQAIDQAQRRVVHGEAVPAREKLLSLFEPHTQVIVRPKAGKRVEFGRKLWLEEVEGGIVSGFKILDGAGQDYIYVRESIAEHKKRFGRPPWLFAGDRGTYSAANEEYAAAEGVKHFAVPYWGKASAERLRQEREGWFRRGYNFRAGIEGRISVLRRRFRLERCLYHGEAGIGRWVGWGIVAANLVKIAQKQTVMA
jgi:IS5 family transposase